MIGHVDRARQRIARWLPDTVTVERITVGALDANQQRVETLTTLYEGPAYLTIQDATQQNVPGDRRPTTSLRARLDPTTRTGTYCAADIRPGDRLTVTASNNEQLTARAWRIVPGEAASAHVTAIVVAEEIER